MLEQDYNWEQAGSNTLYTLSIRPSLVLWNQTYFYNICSLGTIMEESRLNVDGHA